MKKIVILILSVLALGIFTSCSYDKRKVNVATIETDLDVLTEKNFLQDSDRGNFKKFILGKSLVMGNGTISDYSYKDMIKEYLVIKKRDSINLVEIQKKQAELQEAVSISLEEIKLVYVSDKPYLQWKLNITNSSDKLLKGVSGVIVLENSMGEEVYAIDVTMDNLTLKKDSDYVADYLTDFNEYDAEDDALLGMDFSSLSYTWTVSKLAY